MFTYNIFKIIIIIEGDGNMPNILDYVDWRGDITFDKSPFNDIDNLIFTQLSYINFDGIVPSFNENGSIKLSYAADRFFHVHG